MNNIKTLIQKHNKMTLNKFDKTENVNKRAALQLQKQKRMPTQKQMPYKKRHLQSNGNI